MTRSSIGRWLAPSAGPAGSVAQAGVPAARSVLMALMILLPALAGLAGCVSEPPGRQAEPTRPRVQGASPVATPAATPGRITGPSPAPDIAVRVATAEPPAATTATPAPGTVPVATATATAIPPSPAPSATATESDAIPGIQLVPVFPEIPAGAFGSRPLFFTELPDGSRRAAVAEQGGRVYLVDLDDPAARIRLFLDLSDRVSTSGNEEGLLGLAFAPDFRSSQTLYVYYSAASPRRSVISRFRIGADPDTADPASEHRILEVPQPYANHNGGMLAFGPDGFLYVALGDGGSGGDPAGNGQNPATLLGSILRIDVSRADQGKGYATPPDNPFVDRPEQEARHEIWAYGLRNPWRFSFDRATGDLWAGDVGQDAWEEVDLIVRGGNYGWNVMEGGHCYRRDPCDRTGLVPPVAEYSTGRVGCAVTGGYVYRGTRYPELRGVYLYADYCSGLIWGLRHREGALASGPVLVADTGRSISSFGEDRDGEVYVTVFGGGAGGGLYRVSAR